MYPFPRLPITLRLTDRFKMDKEKIAKLQAQIRIGMFKSDSQRTR